MNWWIGGSGIVCAFLGGAVAGVYGRETAPSGFMRGVVVWALLVVAGAISALPGLTFASVTQSTFWTAFWALLIGLGAAAWGGALMGGGRRFVAMSSARYSGTSSEEIRSERIVSAGR
jgi:peptidoglycan/LPS O-acetylase OafA/YrhL